MDLVKLKYNKIPVFHRPVRCRPFTNGRTSLRRLFNPRTREGCDVEVSKEHVRKGKTLSVLKNGLK